MRPGHACPLPGRSGGGVRLSRSFLRGARLVAATCPSVGGRTACRDREASPGPQTADHRGRGRSLFRRQQRPQGIRRGPPYSGGRDAGWEIIAFCRPSAQHGRDRRQRHLGRKHSGRAGRCDSPQLARACRISLPGLGRCSRTTAKQSLVSTRSFSTRRSTVPCRFLATPMPG